MAIRDPGWTRISWEEALAEVSSRLLEAPMGQIRLKARLISSLDPRVVAMQYGWWQACQGLGLPGYDPFGPDGVNVNRLIPNDVIDPISGSVPHRSQKCRVRKA